MQKCIGNYNFSIENICISRTNFVPLHTKQNQKYDGKERYYPQNQRADLQREG